MDDTVLPWLRLCPSDGCICLCGHFQQALGLGAEPRTCICSALLTQGWPGIELLCFHSIPLLLESLCGRSVSEVSGSFWSWWLELRHKVKCCWPVGYWRWYWLLVAPDGLHPFQRECDLLVFALFSQMSGRVCPPLTMSLNARVHD